MNKLSQDILGGKKMKKRMFAALLAVSMMIGMTACGSDNSSAGNSASGSSTETAKSDNAGSDSS